MSDEVVIIEYDPTWKDIFEKEKKVILEALGDSNIKIEHMGSTAVVDLAAKPIIDILVGIEEISDAEKYIPIIEGLNYQYVPEFETIFPNRRYFRKPPKGVGKRKYHLHMVQIGSPFWTRQLIFRDYLRTHPKTRDKYAELKKELASKYRNNREVYTDSKTDFILSVLEKAKEKSENETKDEK